MGVPPLLALPVGEIDDLAPDPPIPRSSKLSLVLAYPETGNDEALCCSYEGEVLALAVLALEGVAWLCGAVVWRSEVPRLSMLPARSLPGDCFFGGEYAGGGGAG